MSTLGTLDRFLDPKSGCLTPQVAQRIVDWRLDAESQARVEELARKANEGTLTPAEEEEYREYIDDGDLIALLQAKARRIVGHTDR